MHWLPIRAIELQACQVHIRDIARITSDECQMMPHVNHQTGSSDIFTMCRATVEKLTWATSRLLLPVLACEHNACFVVYLVGNNMCCRNLLNGHSFNWHCKLL